MIWVILSRLSPAAMIAIVVFVFYEGVPVINDIPFVDRIPGIGDLAVGRVGRARQEGARAEADKWHRARLEAIEEQDKRRRQTQTVIDAIERDYLDRIAQMRLANSHREKLSDADFKCVAGDDGDYLSDGLSRAIIEAGQGQSGAGSDP